MYKLIFFMLILFTNSLADDKNEAKNSGNTSGQAAIAKYGSKSKINSNISVPLQTTGQMTSLDGSKTFDAKIESCAENNDGIKLVFLPQLNGLLNVQINQDLNATGSYNYSVDLSGIENICSGGFQSNNGKSYKYKFSVDTKKLFLIETTKSEMQGCFCITNSCNYNGYSQNTADKITGDIIGTIGSSGIANYQVGINRYDNTNKTYYLYVKNNTNCQDSNLGNNYTNTNPTSYYSSQTIPNLDITDVAAKDSNKTDSLYYVTSNQNNTVINTSNGGANHNITMKNITPCTIIKTPYLDSDGKIKIEEKNSCVDINGCILEREEICDGSGRNCINKIVNRVATSFTIPLQCQVFNAEYQVCANGNNIITVSNDGTGSNIIYNEDGNSYFYSKRYYDCGTQTILHDASKTNMSFSSVNKNGSILNYTDFDGESQNIYLGEFEDCQIRYCRVKINSIHTQVYTDGTSNVSTKDGVSTIEYEFKQCTQLANNSYTCPLESGQTMIEDCSCNLSMNAAGMAIGYASAIEDAVKDFTCSSN
ncbi:hypothetical protein N5912_00760 [Arcobacter lacus]|uniref:hypothetical protein n=1 Tax=Arcobacter lacus TaxID=1912876 RepID=UPI0021BBAE8B|nr:hypothetical protein [Arcobacter lacus]MCT7910349.1 hypothetical protein [Arcobacter lacus]